MTENTKTILVADDDAAIRITLRQLLRRAGYDVATADSPDAVVGALRSSSRPDLIIMDMNFSGATTGRDGLELLAKTRILSPETIVILMTAWGSIDLAVAGVKAGAADFVTKPWDNRDILRRIATALELSDSRKQTGPSGLLDRCGIIGSDPALEQVLRTVARVAPTDASVLILGENGTGKELIARAIHANSRRRSGPMVSVNLGGIPRQLFESEMFGYVKGAFTDARDSRKGRFEIADGGTIFLDEIGELDATSQVKMLRVLQEHTFERLGESIPRRSDFRVVSATNADLNAMVADGRFREDLFYRLNLITLRIPSLRERPGDIPALAESFIGAMAAAQGITAPRLSAGAMEALKAYPFPGNIRELRNLVERAMLIYADGRSELGAECFDLGQTPSPQGATTAGSLDEIERRAVTDALQQADGNISQAARALGLTRQALYRKLERLGISRPQSTFSGSDKT